MPSEGEPLSTTTTTRDEALRLLASGSPHDRLRGARFFARQGRAKDAGLLKKSKAQESDSYVARTLEIAIKRISPVANAETKHPIAVADDDDERNTRARLDAVNWIAGLLLHEIASPIGLVEEAATREVPNYERSQVHARINHLQRVFAGIEQLKSASSTPQSTDFDVSAWLKSVVEEEQLARGTSVAYQGATPFMISADPKLLRFAFCNGFKNAVEAVETTAHTEAYPLIVTWGESDSDFWIVVRDHGPGIVGSPQLAFDIGQTTKANHSGFGLAIARLSMESMDGTVTLQPGRLAGAVYELRWPRK